MTAERNRWYVINEAESIDTPALLVYTDRVIKNIHLLKSMIDDPGRLRPHVKTHKTKEAVLLMMSSGINKFKCATLAEAEMLGMCKAENVLLAYPITGIKLSRFISLVKKYPLTKFSCLVDNLDSAMYISKHASENSINISVYLDLNVGMNRTGILPGKEAVKLYEDCFQLSNIITCGLHVYDGHIKEKEFSKRVDACNKAFEPVEKMRSILSVKGYPELNIIAGGSATFPVHAKRKDVECSPGTFVYWDKGYSDSIPEQKFLPAAMVITRVISIPTPTSLCVDLGYKSIASENTLDNRFYFPDHPDLEPVSQSEEHLVLSCSASKSWKIGDTIYVMPVHICPTCALYDYANIIEGNKFVGTWNIIARSRSISV